MTSQLMFRSRVKVQRGIEEHATLRQSRSYDAHSQVLE